MVRQIWHVLYINTVISKISRMKYWNQEISIIGVEYGVSHNLIYKQYQEIFPVDCACAWTISKRVGKYV